MSASGSWKVTMSTPIGPQVMQLHIAVRDDHFTGRIEGSMGNLDITGGVKGNTLDWVMQVAKPMRIKVTFDVVVDGDTMSGTAKTTLVGKAKLTGERMASGVSGAGSGERQATPDGSVTADSVDPVYNEPHVEINELRSDPVPHRYVHGGFKGTDARFSFYFPPQDRYEGRFFHNTYPLATSSDIGPFPIAFDVATGNLEFTIASGAYYVQTNLGGADRAPPADPAIGAYRVNAAAAKYSRVVAAELYGDHRPYGYLFGGSGGSYQTMGSAENTSGVWDGFMPFVMATPNAIPSGFTVRMHALRVLKRRNKFPGILDAINPGGSGDPDAGLDDEERAALREATLLGYPLRGLWGHETLTSGYFSHVAPLIPMLDPTYIDDFWTKPGYLGGAPESPIGAARFVFDTTVTRVIEGFPRKFELASVPEKDFADAHLVILSGAAAGKSLPIASINDKTIGFALILDQAALNSIRPGDQVRIDNSWTLALQTYQRHQVPTSDMYGWNQFRDSEGKPLYPQREFLIGPIAAAGTAGSVPNGHIHGKMLAVECLMDIDALPWQADWYRSRVKEALGAQFEDNFALWYVDHAQHDNPQNSAARAHTVGYSGVLQQGLRDLSAWVEKGVRPSSTQYEVIDSQVQVPVGADRRQGIQPVVILQVDGNVRAEVPVNQPVTFTATIEVPSNAGLVVAAEWDFEGVGDFPVAARLDTPQTLVRLSAIHSYSRPGTYFAVLRAASQRQGDVDTPFARIENIARVRVTVK
jgi:hypothetical protein